MPSPGSKLSSAVESRIEAAREFGITLPGFVRGHRYNVYTGKERLVHR